MTSQLQLADNPTPTYRGYRRQALYCLFRIFDDGLPENVVVQPEGHEDLAIYSTNGELLEIVQVKDYTSPLTASTFKPSFYKRVSPFCTPNSKVAVKVASFGPIGPEFAKALDNSQVTPQRALGTLTKDRDIIDSQGNKVISPGVSLAQAESIFSHVVLEQVDEEMLTQKVLEQLSATMTSGDPHRALENLMWWLISSAEKQSKLTRVQTIDKIAQIGKFLTHRAAHEHEWNISIKPIQYPAADQLNEQKLKREFFQGGRTRVAHLAANLDVPRVETLQEIHKSFQHKDVVILRAASGQGKTTIAYRYLLDWLPTDFRYDEALQAADLQHARRMSAAIAGHVEVIDVPTIVYVDVRPGDTLWVEFVRELAAINGVRVLVTIREEDWFRSRVTEDDFALHDLPVSFGEETGSEIFTALRENGFGKSQLNFHDAWPQLGDRKTLFEFVYLVTQNERLKDKIKAQISSLKDQVNNGTLTENDLQLLRLVAVASAYESRLKLKPLADYVGIPEPTQILKRFCNEYLLRKSDDRRHIEGFHAIRSEIIAVELTDDVLQPRGEIEAMVIPILVENDLESFLLCSFSRNPQFADRIVRALHEVTLNTWAGVRGICIALQWLGLKDYATTNATLVDNVRTIFGSGWWFTLDWDLAQIRGKEGFKILEGLSHVSKETKFAANASRTVQGQQSNKDEVFSYAAKWLRAFNVPTDDPDTADQFMATAEVLYWMGHLQLTHNAIAEWVNEDLIARAWIVLPIHLFAEFACGVRRFAPETYESWLNSNRKVVEVRLRQLSSIIAFVEEDSCLVAHFAIDIDRTASEIRPVEARASVNDLAVERIEIVSRCLPGFERYGAYGYGHKMSLFDSMNDDSQKCIPAESITMPWLPEFNALARGLVELRFRPDSWEEYFQQIRFMRETVITTFQSLRAVIKNVRTQGASAMRDINSWDECKECVNGDFFLPTNAVDEWGFVSESRGSRYLNEQRTRKFNAISALDPFNKAINEYTRTVTNFLHQSPHALVLVPNLGSVTTDAARKAMLAKAKELNVPESSIRLSVLNGIDACAAVRDLHRVEHLLTQDIQGTLVDERFRQKELDEFINTMQAWAIFCYPEQILPKQTPMKERQTGKRRHQTGLQESLKSTVNRIGDNLKKLKANRINARILTDKIQWDRDTALWISFDTAHPLESFLALERIWFSLVDAFKPDRGKIVRIKAVDLHWNKIVLVPLVRGRSLEKQAFPNMSGVVLPLDENPASQLWRFVPEPIPTAAWNELELACWEPQQSWEVFDQFAAAYGALFHHVDHMADFTRCSIDLDELGEKIIQDYLNTETKRAESFLQQTFDSCARLLEEFPELNQLVEYERPNILNCVNLIIEMKDSIYPVEGFSQQAKLTLDQIANWRNRLQSGFNLLGAARCLWIADSLGLEGFNY